MSVTIYRKNQQGRGEFNGGEILENKPIGFPREGGHLKPFSNLFYWSHAWSEKGSTIGLHPHQGFEILSFVYEGSIEHFDDGDNEWKKLDTGAAQIIRSGKGISHSEKLNPGAHMFQIWLDPNISETLQIPASYNDYSLDKFPKIEENGIEKIIYAGEESPLITHTKGVEIHQLTMNAGKYHLQLSEDKIYSIYLMHGNAKLKEDELEQDDFFLVQDEKEIEVEAAEKVDLFLLANPKKVDYFTYA
jgi:redox-sensitive bicupin YhaK (pirin superfamily)